MKKLILIPVLLVACLPNPQSVKERREEFDRSALKGELIFDATPSNMKPIGAEFGRKVKLLGYTMDPEEPRQADRVKVTFYWQALAPLAEDYEVFIHGDAIGGNAPRIHGDHYPAEGKYPTDVWRENEVVADPFAIWIPAGYGPKQLGIYAGLYKENYRMPLTNKGVANSDNENRSQAITITFP
jgi:hypothetical protein